MQSEYNVTVLASTGLFTAIVEKCSKPSPSGYVNIVTSLGHRGSYRLRYDREVDLVYPGSRVRYRLAEKVYTHLGDEAKTFRKTHFESLDIVSEPTEVMLRYARGRSLAAIPEMVAEKVLVHVLSFDKKKPTTASLEAAVKLSAEAANYAASITDFKFLDSPLSGEDSDQLPYDDEDPGTSISNSEKVSIPTPSINHQSPS